MPATARQVWEKQAAHINLQLSQAGGSPGGDPPSRETALRAQAGGWGASPGRFCPGLHQRATQSLSDVSVCLKMIRKLLEARWHRCYLGSAGLK